MSDRQAVVLESRGLLAVTGADARGFLQGIVSNDLDKVTPAHSVWSALLTPQGKFLHEFFIVAKDDALLLDCEAARLQDLKKRLGIYKLRSQVVLEDLSDRFQVVALFGAAALKALNLPAELGHAQLLDGGVVYTDPRLAALGARAILPLSTVESTLSENGFALAGVTDYDALRLPLGIPDGSRDLEVEKSILLENGFDELNGVDWDKGCFIGQELTARTKYRALIKKRLLPVTIDGPTPAPGTDIMSGEKLAGVMRSVAGDQGLALIRLEYLAEHLEQGSGDFTAGDARIKPRKPDWLVL